VSELRATHDVEPGVARQETCCLATVRRVAAMLDQDPDQWSDGDTLPRGWQFILLGADTRRSALRADGFPGLGVPLPDLGLPRLMLGGRTVEYAGDIRIGTKLRRESRIQQLSHKESANGPIAVVTIRHELFLASSEQPVMVETQTYILMGANTASRKANEPVALAPPESTKCIVPDDTLLFQYSALGFNSHRIHLDRRFARDMEGFPDLVVNGGLATPLLTEFLRTEHGGTFTSFTARHMAPLFCGRSMRLGAELKDGNWRLRAFDDAGRLAVDIQARI
jgi:3-methylfumaryl-CoA hydratase